MSGSTGAARPERAVPSPGRVAWTVARVAVSAAALIAIYYLLPMDRFTAPIAITVLVIGLACFVALIAFQVRLIVKSPFPGLRAAEALGTSVPFFLLFAGTYVVLAELSAENFGEGLSHTDGLYFTVTVFSTVGFGDISAKSEGARLVVTGQMIADLIILGLAIKLLVGAARHGHQQKQVSGGLDADDN